MADSKCLAKLKKSIKGWNAWRTANPEIVPDFSGADLGGADLSKVDFRKAALRRMDPIMAYLRGDLIGGHFIRAADLSRANLRKANLSEADLRGAYLNEACLEEVNLSKAYLARLI